MDKWTELQVDGLDKAANAHHRIMPMVAQLRFLPAMFDIKDNGEGIKKWELPAMILTVVISGARFD